MTNRQSSERRPQQVEANQLAHADSMRGVIAARPSINVHIEEITLGSPANVDVHFAQRLEQTLTKLFMKSGDATDRTASPNVATAEDTDAKVAEIIYGAIRR